MMAFTDPNISGARVRLRRSFEAGEAPVANELRPGEPAINAADGVMYVGKSDGTAGVIPGAVGFNQIVTLTQSQYDAITATVSATTLYIVTPNP
jgi:hypothetical protein